MIDPDTSASVQGDTAARQESATEGYGEGDGRERGGHTAAPDPTTVKTTDDSSAEKDPDAWVTGDEPMTGPQASYLETLAQQAGEEVPTGLTKAKASEEIDRLRSAASPDDPDAGPAKAERPTDSWVTGDEPMTGPQASYLETLAQQAGEEPPKDLTKSQASRAIDDLQART